MILSHSFELEPAEVIQAEQMMREHEQLLARYGAATLELETVRSLLPQNKEHQRNFIRQALERRNISDFVEARIEGGRLNCQLQGDSGRSAYIDGRSVADELAARNMET